MNNIAHKMKHEEGTGQEDCGSAGVALNHRQGRNGFYNIIFIGAFFLVLLVLTSRTGLHAYGLTGYLPALLGHSAVERCSCALQGGNSSDV